MPADKTLNKGVTHAQYAAFEEACLSASLDINAGKEAAFKQFCEAAGVEWPAGHTHGGDRKSMKTYTVVLSEIRNWRQEQIAPSGSGRIELAANDTATAQIEIDGGNLLEVYLSRPAKISASAQNAPYYTRVDGALIVTPQNEIVRHLDPKQIQLR